MESENSFIGNDKLEFRQNVLSHIRNILNLSLRSNRDGEKLKALSPHYYSCRYSGIHHAKKKSAYRNIFRKLNILLKRNDYLKSSVYGEDKDELAQEEGEDD